MGDFDCCEEKKPRTRIITVGAWEDRRVGDTFTGTTDFNGVTYTITGPLQCEGAYGNFYVAGRLPYVTATTLSNGTWRDVKITREVPVRTRTEAVLDLAPGTVFRIKSHSYTYLRLDGDRALHVASDTDYRGKVGTIAPVDVNHFGTGEAGEDEITIIYEPEAS